MANEFTGAADSVVQAGAIHGGVHVHSSAPVSPASEPPAELPPEPPGFVDREWERGLLDAVLARESTAARARYVVISGPSGSGKSALATYWLYRVRSRFADGQVYFDFHARGRSVEVSEVVRHCLRALGVSSEIVPASSDEAVAMLRSRTRGRRLAFLFDNVPAAHELLRLRLSSADILMLVTSHQNAEGLEDVEPVEIGGLGAEPALRLLAEACGSARISAEPEAAARLVELCGGMPIALKVVAGRLAKRPKWTLARVVEELDDGQRLEAVRNTLDFACSHLTDSLGELYRLLGLVPGQSFSASAVAALADSTALAIEDELHELRSVNLLECDDQDQFRFHDLVRLHARSFEVSDDGALGRLVRWYRAHGAFADRAVMDPKRLRVGGDDDLVAGERNPFDRKTGLQWLERERLNIVAVVRVSAERGWNRAVISLCDGPLWALHNQHKHYADMLESLELAVIAAEREGDPVAEARMRTLLVRLRMECHDFEQAHEQARCARECAERSGHRRVLASALEFHGRVFLEQEAWNDSIPLFENARAINEELAKPRGMALQEHFLGQAWDGLGEHREALSYFRTALNRLVGHDDARTPARIRVSMGRALQNLDQHDEAIEILRLAISDMTSRGVSFDLAKPLELLAFSLRANGEDDEAKRCVDRALRIYEEAHSPEADRLRE